MSYNEEFVKRVYKTVVEEGCDSYREIYENTEIEESNDIYYKKALEFYKAMDNDKKEIFLDVIRQTMIDTISHIFGILDGSSTLTGGNIEAYVTLDNVSTENELQDEFLMYVEEKLDRELTEDEKALVKMAYMLGRNHTFDATPMVKKKEK